MWRVKAGRSVLSNDGIGPARYALNSDRSKAEAEARDRLNARAERNEVPGKWPCGFGRCTGSEQVTTHFHDSAAMHLILLSAAYERRVILPAIGKTGLSVVCGPCLTRIREWTFWND